MSGGLIIVIIIAAMFPGLFVLAMAVKWWEVRQAKRWPETKGKVVVSTVGWLQNQPGEMAHNFSDTEVRNEPRVEYEYHVGDQKYRSKRITIGERTSDYELESMLAKYPVGTEVTVYYHPADPNKAVLERDLPAWIWYVGGGCVLAMIAMPLLAVFFYYQGLDWLRPHLRHPERAPFVTAAAGFGLLVFLFGLAFFRMVRQASRWPAVPGQIVQSGVDTFQQWSESDTGRRWRTFHKSSIVYAYRVNGREYCGDRLTVGTVVSSSSPAISERTAAKYPVGKDVVVHYDPQKPGESVLHPRSWTHYILWIVAAIMFGFAWWVGMG
jgi:hypothetical protein